MRNIMQIIFLSFLLYNCKGDNKIYYFYFAKLLKMAQTMKVLFFFIAFLLLVNATLKSQPTSKDTVVCIVDTSNTYVKFTSKPFPDRAPEIRWQVSIQGHYYDNENLKDKDFACVSFHAGDMRNVPPHFKGPFQIKVPKHIIKEPYIVETDEWINKQTDQVILGKRIGNFGFSKYNFVIFKQDYENLNTDSVTMHRVTVGYNEIVE
jgi:hypothetical protein